MAFHNICLSSRLALSSYTVAIVRRGMQTSPSFLCLIFYYVFTSNVCSSIKQSLLKTNASDNRISDGIYSSAGRSGILNAMLEESFWRFCYFHCVHNNYCSGWHSCFILTIYHVLILLRRSIIQTEACRISSLFIQPHTSCGTSHVKPHRKHRNMSFHFSFSNPV
jgi:hypothetical protein